MTAARPESNDAVAGAAQQGAAGSDPGLDRGAGLQLKFATLSTPTAEIGTRLRRARESRQIRIEDAAARLNIRPAVLEAMENDRFDDLPEPPYRIGFLRSYATHVGLDGNKIADLYKAACPPTKAPIVLETELLHQPKLQISDRALLIMPAVIGALAFAAWLVIAGGEPTSLESPAATVPAPAATAPAAPAPTIEHTTSSGVNRQAPSADAHPDGVVDAGRGPLVQRAHAATEPNDGAVAPAEADADSVERGRATIVPAPRPYRAGTSVEAR